MATYERGLFAVDIETGTTQWQYDDSAHDDSAFGACVGIETVISIVDKPESVSSAYGKTVTAFDRETGDVRWNYALDGYHALTIRPILADWGRVLRDRQYRRPGRTRGRSCRVTLFALVFAPK
ncbi:PQQ-binding-like beta-propeller repeat protein [Halogeometricum borinquense]|uniref:outer membrane protein assembly factor BamB family protein n=1 Tax=Halogeometricum borinquense TaxID=60847 RepID=UPI001EF7BDE1|nr:PQQ-binding-like beta-propeller repeat protein [Halogeometricum borinquense]